MTLINKNSVTNYWWDCPSCGKTKNDSLQKDGEGNIIGSQLCCPECFWVRDGRENTYVDHDVYAVPKHLVAALEKYYWKCQACGGLNEQPEGIEVNSLTLDDLYCKHCETWQCDIPDHPQREVTYPAKRIQKSVEEIDRFENPIKPIEYRDFEKETATNSTTPNNLNTPFSIPTKGLALGLSAILAIGGLGFWVHDGTRLRTVEEIVYSPKAETSVAVYEYRIVTKEGWTPSRSAPDFELLSQQTRQNGTRQVPDGFETYYVTETYVASHRTETYTDTVYDRVQSGTRQDCSTSISGGVAKNTCTSVPTYNNVPRTITKTRQVPVTATRQVPKERQKWRTEPTYATWYTWKQGENIRIATPNAYSENFEVPTPDLSQYQGKPNISFGQPASSCSVVVNEKRRSINCQTFITLDRGQVAEVVYSKWGGIKEVNF